MVKTNLSKYLIFLIFVIIAYSIMPIIPRLFSTYLTAYAYLIIVLVAFFAVLAANGVRALSELLPIIAPLLMLNIFIYVVTNPSLILWGYGILLDLVAVFLGWYILKFFDYKMIRTFTVFILLLYAVTAITTIIGLQSNPDAARYLATVADANEADAIMYGFMNIGGYSFVYSVALIYPAIIYGYKRKKIHVVFLIIYALLDFFLIINSGYTIALLLFIMSTVFIFLKKNLQSKNVVIIFVVGLIAILLFFSLVSDGLNSLADIIDNEIISARLRDLAGGRVGLEASEDNRLELYLKSLNSFITHPILGGMFNSVPKGGHSFILDTLAQYGIFGLGTLVVIYISIYREFYRKYKNKIGYGYVFWIFIQPLILSTVNTGMWIYELTLFIPIILAYIDRKGVKDESTLGSKLSPSKNRGRLRY